MNGTLPPKITSLAILKHLCLPLQDAKISWWELATYGTLFLVAATMRLWDLDTRAVHHDESLHAFYAWRLYSGDGLQHNPMMHGPLQIEAIAAAFYLFGDSDYTARLVHALAGTALVGLPLLLRSRLGRLGTIFVSVMLTFSPSMLYFSRFARNDILMSVWTLGIVAGMWRYLDTGKCRYLYITSALLALAFATKETTFMVTLTLGMYLTMVVVSRNWESIIKGAVDGKMSPPAAIVHIIHNAWSAARRSQLSHASRPVGFLILLATLTLPMWSALVSLVQDTHLAKWSGFVLANPVGTSGAIGAPARGGLVIAALVVVVCIWLSVSIGNRWNWNVWWRCASIFSLIWVMLFTTFLTNISGIGSGIWQSLGYWLVQQGEARGGQPWYYYLVISSIYEFLPMLFAVIGGIYYLRRNDPFGRFLVFWSITTFVMYSIASEKMPWLLVNVTLPVIVISGRFLGEITDGIQWHILPKRKVRNLTSFGTIMLAALLLVLTIRSGWYASYQNGDIPVEMIVYTQTSPDVVEVLHHVKKFAESSGDGEGIPITIDQSSGFSWPWAWYLRSYTNVEYVSYNGMPPQDTLSSSVILLHSRNQNEDDLVLTSNHKEGVRIKHRWWFPEVYKDMTLKIFIRSLVDLEAWRKAFGYFLYRELGTPLGSEDAYVYFQKDFPPDFTPLE